MVLVLGPARSTFSRLCVSEAETTAPSSVNPATWAFGEFCSFSAKTWNRSGRMVYYSPNTDFPASTGSGRMDFNVQSYQGQPVLTWREGKVTDTYGAIRRPVPHRRPVVPRLHRELDRHPTEKPAIVAEVNPAGGSTVYAS
jgi:hypothetical protein